MTHPVSGRLAIARATPDEWRVVGEWAADEGWNPGHGDAAAFFAQDPDGFFLGTIDGDPVSAVSVVNYGDAYAFLGFYLVRPDLRGRGHGIAVWNEALKHAGTRTVGLDGVPAQQDNYRVSGFRHAYNTRRHLGAVAPADGAAPAGVRPVEAADLPAVAAYDNACTPADRPRFLASWLTAPGHHALVRIVDGRLTGYGVIRPAREVPRVGPLFADTRADAEALLDGLAAAAGGGPLALDVPESNPQAVALAEARGMKPAFDTARMYTGPVRPFAQGQVFGVTTLELG